jgi:hypothetical protein
MTEGHEGVDPLILIIKFKVHFPTRTPRCGLFIFFLFIYKEVYEKALEFRQVHYLGSFKVF